MVCHPRHHSLSVTCWNFKRRSICTVEPAYIYGLAGFLSIRSGALLFTQSRRHGHVSIHHYASCYKNTVRNEQVMYKNISWAGFFGSNCSQFFTVRPDLKYFWKRQRVTLKSGSTVSPYLQMSGNRDLSTETLILFTWSLKISLRTLFEQCSISTPSGFPARQRFCRRILGKSHHFHKAQNFDLHLFQSRHS